MKGKSKRKTMMVDYLKQLNSKGREKDVNSWDGKTRSKVEKISILLDKRWRDSRYKKGDGI